MLCAAGAALWTVACGEAQPAEPCTGVATGDLTVNITGVPAGADAFVRVTGPGGVFDLTSSQTIAGVLSGEYTVEAGNIAVFDSLISRMYKGRPQAAAVCVRDGAARTTTVTYAQIPTSNTLWYGAGYYSLGFRSSQLGTTATLAPTVTAGTRGGAGVTFDRDGNLWVRGQSASEPVLMRYSAAALAATGNPLPDRTIGITGLDCVSPGFLAFDAAGNLWMSLGCQGRVVRLTPAQLTLSGTVTPAVQITNLTNPQGIAFDYVGNLWVADQEQLKRYDAARLAASTSTAADLRITFTTPSPPAPGQTALAASHVAFAPDGELWVSSYEQKALYRVEPATIALTGAQAATPVRIVYLNEFTMPKGMAFDNAGGLYVGFEQAKFARLSPAQLDANSTPAAPTVPNRVFASGNILGFGDDIAVYPAPAGTPLYHRAP